MLAPAPHLGWGCCGKAERQATSFRPDNDPALAHTPGRLNTGLPGDKSAKFWEAGWGRRGVSPGDSTGKVTLLVLPFPEPWGPTRLVYTVSSETGSWLFQSHCGPSDFENKWSLVKLAFPFLSTLEKCILSQKPWDFCSPVSVLWSCNYVLLCISQILKLLYHNDDNNSN